MNGKKFRELRELSGKTQKEVALDIGVSLRTIQNWESNEGVINVLAEKYILGLNNDEVKAVPFDNYMEAEYTKLSTAAGQLGVEDVAELPETRKKLVPREFERGNYLVVNVDGDSMDDGSSASIPYGSDILVKEYILNNGDKLPIRNNLFVIVTKTGTVFKQIVEHNTEEGYIMCHSYNPKYKDYPIELSEVLQIFIYRKIVSSRPPIHEINYGNN